MAQPNSRRSLVKSPIYRIRGRSDFLYGDPRLNPENTETMNNVNITERGTARKRRGNGLYNSAQITETAVAKDVVGLRQQLFSDGTTKQLELAGTKVYTDDGTTRADITGAVTITDQAENRCRFEFIQDQVVINNGADATIVYSGTGNASALTGVLWTKCGDIVLHKNMLFVMDTTESAVRYPTRLRWCDINISTYAIDITVWPTDQYYEVYQGGAAILGGVEAFGRLMVVKRDGIYPINVGVEEGFVEAIADTPLRGFFSPIARGSIIARPEFVWMIAEDGAYIVRPDMSFELVTAAIQTEWNGLNLSRLQYAQSWVREKDHQVRTLMSSSSNTTAHDLVMVWDWQTNDIFFDKLSSPINYGTSWRIFNTENDMLGSADGYVYKANDSSKVDDNGTDIAWKIKMVPNDLGLPGVNKQIVMINSIFRTTTGQQVAEFVVHRDMGAEKTRIGNLTIGTSLTWDSGVLWDTGKKWVGNQTEIKGFFVNKTAETVAPEWNGTQDFELQGYQVEYIVVE
jgi:hypothetical protein